MNLTLNRVIRKMLLPTMEKYGFALEEEAVRGNVWSFKKKDGREKSIAVFSPRRGSVKLTLRLSPSQKYNYVEMRDEWLLGQTERWHPGLREWSCSTKKEMEETIKLICGASEKIFFSLLDEWEKEYDPYFYVDINKQREFLNRHEEYQQEFMQKYQLNSLDKTDILNAIQAAVDSWSGEHEDAEHQLMLIAAMYGKLLELSGGTWGEKTDRKGNFHHAIVRMPCRCDGYIGMTDDIPVLTDIYGYTQDHCSIIKIYTELMKFVGTEEYAGPSA